MRRFQLFLCSAVWLMAFAPSSQAMPQGRPWKTDQSLVNFVPEINGTSTRAALAIVILGSMMLVANRKPNVGTDS